MNTKPLNMDRVLILRRQAGMTQRELAKKAGTTPQCICQIESGYRLPRLETAFALAEALNTSIYDIVGRSHYPRNDETLKCELIKTQQRLAEIAELANGVEK